jgi:bis(5'-nucleosyl)-tetraphosphatase (symmetrical)
MSIYAVGDIQGCYDPLQRLLEQVGFDPAQDQLWSTGDIVNRGPESLRTLRFFHDLGRAATVVLGNHDLHLLAVAHGDARMKRKDTLQEILDAPDVENLLAWLRNCPLLHVSHGFALVHAGIPPQWTINEALTRAAEVETVLQGDDYRDFLRVMYGNQPDLWDNALKGLDRLRLITNYFTRMRFCTVEGRLELENKLGPETAKPGTQPWFTVPGRKNAGDEILFGHWAYLKGESNTPRVYALDTGCIWGGVLTMMRLEDRKVFTTGDGR